MEATEILVIILSSLLAFFLVLSVVLVIILIKIAKQIKRVTNTAERTVAGLEGFAMTFGKTAVPAAVAKLVLQQIRKFASKK